MITCLPLHGSKKELNIVNEALTPSLLFGTVVEQGKLIGTRQCDQ